ncbi:MAG: acyl-CoA reductase [Bacteroidetes bacterium]|nr:acyl-CoA reductase [Bacteroidota bacterium]
MDLKERIESFAELGRLLRELPVKNGDRYLSNLTELINTQHLKNAWFTPAYVTEAIRAIGNVLTSENLFKWTGMYPELNSKRDLNNIGVIMAGNIPLVGFHDFLSVLISGNILNAKASSKDSDLIINISDLLCTINPHFRDLVHFSDGTLSGFDAVIATGSNNTSRYFENYFSKYPNIIRRNRNSIAILTGSETDQDLTDLGKDIFTYFGLGCRNVSKIFIPEGYDLKNLLNKWEPFSDVINNSKYANNYDYNKAIYLVNKEKFLDTGYLLLKEEMRISSPVSVLYYEHYSNHSDLIQNIDYIKDSIQCVVSSDIIPFGRAQQPELWDYADGIDTIEFLLKKKSPGIL